MVSCVDPVPARVLSLQSKLSNAPFSGLVSSRSVGRGTLCCSIDLFSKIHINSFDCVVADTYSVVAESVKLCTP